MRFLRSALLFAVGLTLWGQTDRGTITGTVVDPAGAVVPNVPVQARNVNTAAVFAGETSATGNYTLPSLSAGSYELTVTASGFKQYVRQNLTVQAAQTIRIDVTLEVGTSAESITVTDSAPLLKTESGEMSHVIATDRMNSLPLLQSGPAAGSSGIRNPYAVVALIPGSALTPGAVAPTVRINGGVNNSYTILIEGMDATNSLGAGATQQNQPGVDSIQEWTVQTSNYAAEFGQVGNAIMNVTMRSGTNQYHGSAYEYWVNEALNAGQPFTNDGAGKLIRPRTRRNDYGFTLGGPISIPKLYDGRNRTFFFYNWEEFRIANNILPAAISVPTSAYRVGDFSRARLTNRLGADPLGRDIFPNMVYDPATRQTVGSQIVTDPFPGNIVPASRFDPVAMNIQALIPNPTDPNLLVNNYRASYRQERTTGVPSIKIDQMLGSKHKLSFLWNRTRTFCWECAGAVGLPQPISPTVGTNIRAHNERLNWDYTVTPTVLFHLGVGYSQNWLGRPALTPDFNAATLGLTGPFTRPATFPVITGLTNAQVGGMNNMGTTAGSNDDVFQQGNAIASLSWVKNNHSLKFGGELRNQGDYNLNAGAMNGTYTFSNTQTAQPYVVATNANGQVAGNPIGFPYASFMLGLVNVANGKPESRGRVGKKQLGFYAQDTWKVTRKLTLDIGIRYDYSTYLKEQYGRTPTLGPDTPNPSSGGHPGAVLFEATCGCNFAKNYPWGFAPRLGAAYQINDKTVLRAGFGIVYSGTPSYNLSGGAASASNPIGPNPDFGREIMSLRTGNPLTFQQIAWPNFNPGYYPVNAIVGAGMPQVVDQNAGRPSRQYQWSVNLQREVVRDLLVEVSYVANRHIWLTANNLVNYNFLNGSMLRQYGLDLNNAADRTMLTAQVGSAAAGRFRNQLPFAGFPTTATVAQSLRPFPQFNSGLGSIWAPLGNAWYDSLQMKVTKRFSHGLDFTYAFTFQKELDNLRAANDVENRRNMRGLSTNSRPFLNNLGFNYTTPKWQLNRAVSLVTGDWQFGGFLQYVSGLPIAVPAANLNPTLNNMVFQGTVQNRVPGQPLFLQDLNCHCFDPNTNFVLNPAAWENPTPGQFGSAITYNDYREQRRPTESLSLARVFRIKERVTFTVRAELTNAFNRTFMSNPTSGNPQAPQNRVNNADPNSQTTAGFGFINTTTVAAQPRQGQLVARITF